MHVTATKFPGAGLLIRLVMQQCRGRSQLGCDSDGGVCDNRRGEVLAEAPQQAVGTGGGDSEAEADGEGEDEAGISVRRSGQRQPVELVFVC
jgi:hypothetical protein